VWHRLVFQCRTRFGVTLLSVLYARAVGQRYDGLSSHFFSTNFCLFTDLCALGMLCSLAIVCVDHTSLYAGQVMPHLNKFAGLLLNFLRDVGRNSYGSNACYTVQAFLPFLQYTCAQPGPSRDSSASYASFNIYAPVTCPTEACAKGCSNISRILRPRRLRSGRPPSLPCSEKASSTYHTFVLIVRLLVLR